MNAASTRLVLALALCLASPAWAVSFQCDAPVTVWANPRLAQGDLAAAVQLQDLSLASTTLGYGATTGLGDEITVVDGRVLLDRNAGGSATPRAVAAGDGAVKLVLSSPAVWTTQPRPLDGISSFDSLNFALDDAVEAMSCGAEAVVPFKITGHASTVTWSVANRQPGRDLLTTTRDVDVVLVGLHATADRDRLGLAKGYNLHVHVWMPQPALAGHLVDLHLDDGALLSLPTRR